MKPIYITLSFLLINIFISNAQVGIGNTNPKAKLDVTASNVATPANTDGILIPRIDNFPNTNPTADQNGMLLFVTGNGTPSKGFYYWDNGNTSWISVIAAKSINDLTDGKSDNDGTQNGSSLFLGVNAGANDDTTNNHNVGVGFQSLYTNTSGFSNTANGYVSLYYNTTGSSNTATGAGALYSNTTGSYNTVNGLSSLYSNTTGSSNTANGTNSLRNNTIGNFNTANGLAALYSNTEGYLNTANGANSLHNNTTGSSNTANGLDALYNNTTGSSNTANGKAALFYNTTGNKNVALGYRAGYNETGSNKLYIENSDAHPNNALIYGEFGTDNTTTGNILRTNSQFQIGNPALTGYAFPTTDGTANQIMQTDGTGQLSFVDANTIGTDNQDLSLSGNTLSLTNDVTTVDLSSYLDNTDNQTIDAFSFNTGTNVLTLEIQNDGVAAQTVDLSSLQDADWYEAGDTPPNNINDNIYTYGNVGIGTSTMGNYTNASRILSIKAENTANPIDPAFIEIIGNTGTTNSVVGGIHFENSPGGSFGNGIARIEAILNGSTAFAGDLAFFVGDMSGNLLERMRISDDGSILIGTENPGGRLYVDGSFVLKDGTEGNNKILQSDAFGAASWVNASSIFTDTDNQDLSLSGNTLSLTNDATTVDLSTYLDNTDNQDLSITGNTLSLTNDATTVDLSTYLDNTDNQTIDTFSLNSGTNVLTLEIQNDGVVAQTVDLSSYLDNTDNQDLNLSGNTLSLTNDATTVDLSSYLDNTDNQTIDTFSLNSGTNVLTLEIQNDGVAAQTVDLSSYLDNTDNQDLSISGNTLSLTNDATTVDLSSYLDNTDNQDLNLSGNTLSLTNDATTVDLSSYLDNTDNQKVTNFVLSGTILGIALENDGVPPVTVDLSSLQDGVGAQKINDLIDGKSDNDGSQNGSSLFLGIGAGANDDSTDNKNVGIGFQSLNANTTGGSNTATGHQSLYANTTGVSNTATGYQSLNANTTGYANTAIGYQSLYSNTGGAANTATGDYALYSNTTGDGNTANGDSALSSNTTGDFNTATGGYALFNNTTGSYNTATGRGALRENTTGNFNTATGRYALISNTTGSYNVALGYGAGQYETGSNKLYIENSDADPNNALIYGEFGTDNTTTGNILRTNSQFQIGNPTGAGYAFPTTDGTPNQVMQTDGAGQLSFVDANTIGVQQINDLADGKSDNDGTQNGSSLFLGIGAGANDDSTDNRNVGIGFQSINANSTGYEITATGYQSLYSNTTGYRNIANGAYALYYNTTGHKNTANGTYALYYNTTGESNTANGDAALSLNTTGYGNTANGVDALDNNTTGYRNTANGAYALDNNTTGNLNTANGVFALYWNSSGNGNVALGNRAGYNETGSNKLYIENSNADADNALIYGEFGTDNTTTGNILRTNSQFQIGNPTGTGYAFPTTDGTANQIMQTDGAGQVSFVNPSSVFSDDADWYEAGGTPPNNINDNIYTYGNVGIGTSSTGYRLDVLDSQSSSFIARFNNTSTDTNADGIRIRLAATSLTTNNYFIGFYRGLGNNSGKIVGNGTGVLYQTTSDRRLKTNIKDISESLALINKMQPRIYEYKAIKGKKEFGFIAQELQQVYPQAVSGDPNGNPDTDPMMVDYSRLTPVLTAGIKELNNKVTKQQTEINQLKTENLKLKQQLLKYAELEKRIFNLEKRLKN